MRLHEPALSAPRWDASLSLEFARRHGASVLAARRHIGPLVVQKTLHPEGDGVCHAIVLHPPGGVCGGDALQLDIAVDAGAHALVTTPGAGKWYRSAGGDASQHIRCRIADGAVLEWLPQETIVFDGARATLGLHVELAADACFIGWDVLCLGRTAAGETFRHGLLNTATRIVVQGRPVWVERGRIAGGASILGATPGMAGQPVTGTLLAAGACEQRVLLDALREQAADDGLWGVTALPGLVVVRYLGPSAQSARDYFTRLWRILRPALAGRDAQPPRIWKT
jgi:urease accessory protein